MNIKVVYTNKAIKSLKKIDVKFSRQIVVKIAFYSEQKNPIGKAKKLNPPFDNLYRFRVGDYRIIFDIDKKGNLTILTILTIKHRKDIY